MSTNSPLFRFPRQTALAASLTLALMGSDITLAVATTRTVTNCLDGINIAGSLRAAVAAAVSGDSIDLSTLQCSPITLTTGSVRISADDITLNGPTDKTLVIEGDRYTSDRVLNHEGYGTLAINHVTISHGHPYSNTQQILGGCIFSTGKVSLTASVVSDCIAEVRGQLVCGGGIFAASDVSLIKSTVSSNSTQVFAGVGGSTYSGGGGICNTGNLLVQESTIRDNRSDGLSGGGIINLAGRITIDRSTISGNQAQAAAGAAFVYSCQDVSITNSTISGNQSTAGGAIYSVCPVSLANSTIAFNTAGLTVGTAGLWVLAPSVLTSSIIANNTVLGVPNDLLANSAIAGSHNLIQAPTPGTMVPSDTASVCPQLEPLANNGGPTQTHALRSTSWGINHGNTSALMTDQRGSGYPRLFGPFVDIGAYEWQGGPNERIFHSGFESGCDE